MKRAAIYRRVSTEEQASSDHHSLAYQLARAEAYAQLKDWRVVSIYTDVASGRDTQRDGFQALQSAIGLRAVDVVVVFRLDRLSRNVRDIYDFLAGISNTEVDFVSICESFDTTTAMGRAWLGMAAVFAQLGREMLSENVADAMLQRARMGLPLGGIPPLGYRIEDGQLSVDEEEARTVRLIFDLYVRRHWTQVRIAEHLNERAYKTRKAGRWHSTAISRILARPTYTGTILHKGRGYTGQHEPIVEPRVYELARGLARRRDSRVRSIGEPLQLLTGLVYCGRCGRSMGVRRRGPPRCETQQRLAYYGHGAPTRRGATCPSITKRVVAVDGVVLAILRGLCGLARVANTTTDGHVTLTQSTTGLGGLPSLPDARQISRSADPAAEGPPEPSDGIGPGEPDGASYFSPAAVSALSARLATGLPRAAWDGLRAFADDWDGLEVPDRQALLWTLVERVEVWRRRVRVRLHSIVPLQMAAMPCHSFVPRVIRLAATDAPNVRTAHSDP